MFKVVRRLGRNETVLEQFNKQQDAEKFIFEKLREDTLYKLVSSYLLYEGMDILREYTEKDLPPEVPSSSGSSQGSRQSFNPTPFNAAPRPASMPKSGFKEESDDDDTKK